MAAVGILVRRSMSDSSENQQLISWLQSQNKNQNHLPALLKLVEEQLEANINAALNPGPTELEKGQVQALRWLLDTIDALLTDTETETGEA
jgi:hypothetical protein